MGGFSGVLDNGLAGSPQSLDLPHPSARILERDIVLSSGSLEHGLLALREKPSAALRWLTGRSDPAQPPPFPVSALRFDHEAAEDLRLKMAAGETLNLKSNWPIGWQEAVLQHLHLTPATCREPVAARSAQVDRPSPWLAAIKAMRPHQWSKNVLVFLPLLMAHLVFDGGVVIASLLAFLCFGMVASSIYIINDLMDLRQDRRHPSKHKRPFASGSLTPGTGLLLVLLLLSGAGLIMLHLPRAFAGVIGVYVAMNLAYTFHFKRKLLVDVLTLAFAYTLRILAGNAATMIELSNWLLGFSMFIFLSLALVKRYVEIDTTDETTDEDPKRVMGRGYRRVDLEMLAQMGIASTFAAIVVLALYIESAGRKNLYSERELIWLVCPLVLYVIMRIWFLARRREMNDDPILFIVKDWRSYLAGCIMVGIFLLAV